MKYNSILFEMWTEEDMDRLFGFLYTNKCIANYSEDTDGQELENCEIEVLSGIDHIELYDGSITLVADTFDKITFKDNEYYKVTFH